MTPGAPSVRILAMHSEAPSPWAEILTATDEATERRVEHRDLAERAGDWKRLIAITPETIERCHASPERRAQAESRLQAVRTLGLKNSRLLIGISRRRSRRARVQLPKCFLPNIWRPSFPVSFTPRSGPGGRAWGP